MTAAKKFMFDLTFDAENAGQETLENSNTQQPQGENGEGETVPEEPTFSAEDVESARNEGFQRGREDATRELASAVERQTLDILGTIGTRLSELFESEQLANTNRNRDAVIVAIAIARKLFPHMSDTHGTREVEALVLRAMEELTEETKVTLRLHPDMVIMIKESIARLATETHFKGSIEFHGDETMDASDCRISWGMGGISRSTADLWQKIDEIVEENLGSDLETLINHPAEKAGAGQADMTGANADEHAGMNKEIASDADDNSVPAPTEAVPDAGEDHG